MNRYKNEMWAWNNMKRRCYVPEEKSYPDYGGRGITVCEEWRNSFGSFLRDVGPRPSRTHSIDRIDSNGNYEPGNCQWATKVQQNNNRRGVHTVLFRGWLMTIGEARLLTKSPIYHKLVLSRVKRGWNIEEALTTPAQSRAKENA